MRIFFLDVAISDFSESYKSVYNVEASTGDQVWAVAIVMAVVVLLEALLLFFTRYSRFLKSLLSAAIINIASLAAGMLYSEIYKTEIAATLNGFLAAFVATVVIETIGLILLNRSKKISSSIGAGLLINIVSYGLLYFMLNR